ncbi:MAG: hypothetical protein ACJ8EY_11740 [Sphingomicrobium sp.]
MIDFVPTGEPARVSFFKFSTSRGVLFSRSPGALLRAGAPEYVD